MTHSLRSMTFLIIRLGIPSQNHKVAVIALYAVLLGGRTFPLLDISRMGERPLNDIDQETSTATLMRNVYDQARAYDLHSYKNNFPKS